MDLENEIKTCIRYGLTKTDSDIFNSILDRLKVYIDKPCSSITELKRRTTKGKGDVFETFCVMYLKAVGYDEAWLLKDIPKDLLEKFELKPKDDNGIDIVAKKYGKYYAVQAKYRTPPRDKRKPHSVKWSSLSTFYALCQRTGPWHKRIVMTNCNYVNRKGRKDENDYTMAKKRFENTPRAIWLKMIGDKGYSMQNDENNDNEEKKEDNNKNEEVREKRANYFEKLLQNVNN